MIVDDNKKHLAQQESGYSEKRGGRDVCQPCSGVIGWGYNDIQGVNENELRII